MTTTIIVLLVICGIIIIYLSATCKIQDNDRDKPGMDDLGDGSF